MSDASKNILLKVENLSTSFYTEEGVVNSVSGVSFDVEKGKTVAIVGESGCGKSVTALSIMGLVPSPPGKVIGGKIVFDGKDLLGFSEKQMRGVRGNDIAMIFQEPMTSLNPVFTVGNQIIEAIMLHQKLKYGDARKLAIETLGKVGIADPHFRIDEYPHQLSGGMRQRVMIAMAISCLPAMLIADEPTTALDVTIQAQILDLLDELQSQLGMSILLITHDLAVVAERSDEVVVMYASKVVEKCKTAELFEKPMHPYTKGLLRSLPVLGGNAERLETIAGSVPEPLHFPKGCKFNPRCPLCQGSQICLEVEPQLREVAKGRFASCHKIDVEKEGL